MKTNKCVICGKETTKKGDYCSVECSCIGLCNAFGVEKKWEVKKRNLDTLYKKKVKEKSRKMSLDLLKKDWEWCKDLAFGTCKECGCKDKLEIHHEIYPTTKIGIIQAIKSKQICHLCRTCHTLIHKKNGL